MAADLSASAYFADGTDLAATGVSLTHDGAGLYSGLAEDVGVATYPGSDAGTILGGAYRPFQHATMYLVRGGSFDDVWSKIRALRRRCKPGRTVTLTRQMPDPDGTDANTPATATARRQTDRVEWLAETAAVVDIDWLIVDGVWQGSAVAIAVAAGVQTILGDTRTRRMTLTLAAGAARTVTNTTNGYAFTFGTTVPSGGIIVDVAARTATAITGGADYSAYLSWTKDLPMQLEAGSNTLTVSAGSASISYQPAYL
jgi:hypothetical protein